jgi:hypothetical protein
VLAARAHRHLARAAGNHARPVAPALGQSRPWRERLRDGPLLVLRGEHGVDKLGYVPDVIGQIRLHRGRAADREVVRRHAERDPRPPTAAG